MLGWQPILGFFALILMLTAQGQALPPQTEPPNDALAPRPAAPQKAHVGWTPTRVKLDGSDIEPFLACLFP